MPHLKQLHRDLSNQGFLLVSVNAGDEQLSRIDSFIRQQGLTFPVFVDDGSLRRRFRVDSFPTAFLVDRHGTVRRVYIGDTSPSSLREHIRELLAEADEH
jgi:hypothetical protein